MSRKEENANSSQPITVGLLKELLDANNLVLQKNINAANKEEISELKREILSAKSEIQDTVNEALNEVNTKIQRLEDLNQEKDALIEQQNSKISELQIEIRKRNIVIYNINETESSSKSLENIVLDVLNEKTGGKLTVENIENCFRMGKSTNGLDRPRPILVSFLSLKTKNFIMKNVKKIVEAGYGISDDFPKEINEKRKELVPIMKKLKDENFKVSLRKDKLFVNGVEWTQEMIQHFKTKSESESNFEHIQKTSVEESNQLQNDIEHSVPQTTETVQKSIEASLDIDSSKRLREDTYSDSNASKTPKLNERKTIFIGTSTNQRYGYGKNPIKEALKRQASSTKSDK